VILNASNGRETHFLRLEMTELFYEKKLQGIAFSLQLQLPVEYKCAIVAAMRKLLIHIQSLLKKAQLSPC
jgi:hypothetical protein